MRTMTEPTTTRDERRAPRSLVTCANCGNSGPAHQFETPAGTMECGDCGNTRQFRVEAEGCACGRGVRA